MVQQVQLIELTQENFETEVLAPDTGLVFVDCWSPLCAPCLGLMPIVEALARQNTGRVKFCTLDITRNKRLSFSQRVRSIPSFMLYLNGKKVFVFDKNDIDMTAVQAKLNEWSG